MCQRACEEEVPMSEPETGTPIRNGSNLAAKQIPVPA
jgi:hypothetical protein